MSNKRKLKLSPRSHRSLKVYYFCVFLLQHKITQSYSNIAEILQRYLLRILCCGFIVSLNSILKEKIGCECQF